MKEKKERINLMYELDLKDPEKREKVIGIRNSIENDMEAREYYENRIENLNRGTRSFKDQYNNLKEELPCFDWSADTRNKNFNQARMIKAMMQYELEPILERLDKLEKNPAAKTVKKGNENG